jgi:hypothetical protein
VKFVGILDKDIGPGISEEEVNFN